MQLQRAAKLCFSLADRPEHVELWRKDKPSHNEVHHAIDARRTTGAFKNESQPHGGEGRRWQIAEHRNGWSAVEKSGRTDADATPRRPVAIRKSAQRANFILAAGVGRVGIQVHRKAKTKGDTRDTGPLEQKI